jgi:hypothetical protein
MYVPKTIYENAPYYWIVLGIALILLGVFYFRIGHQEYFMAGAGGGAIAFVWGLFVLGRRLAQKKRKVCSTYDEYLDQTMELNLRNLPPAGHPTHAEPPAPE